MKIKVVVVTSLFLLIAVSLSYAGNVNGTWKSKMVMQDGNELDLTFTFKVKGDTLTGVVKSSYGDMPIYNGRIMGDEFSYQIDVNGNTMTNLGKVDGDKIKLKAKDFPMELELTRVIEASKINGSWLTKVQGPDGEMEITLTFGVEGNKLTGSNKSAMGEIPLLNGVVNGDEFTFDIDFGGNSISHKCKYNPDDTIGVKVFAMGQEISMTLVRKK